LRSVLRIFILPLRYFDLTKKEKEIEGDIPILAGVQITSRHPRTFMESLWDISEQLRLF